MAVSMSSTDKLRHIRKGMGNPDVGEVSDQDLATYLHEAQKILASIHEFESLSTYEDVTTDGSDDYTLTATDVLRIIEPPQNITGNRPMELSDLRWDRQHGQFIGSGSGNWVIPVSLEEGVCKVRVRPTSSGETIRIHYIKIPTSPGYNAATENTSEIPESFNMAEISTAIMIGLELTSQREEAMAEMQLGGVHQTAGARAMPKGVAHYYLTTAAHRLLGRKGGRRR